MAIITWPTYVESKTLDPGVESRVVVTRVWWWGGDDRWVIGYSYRKAERSAVLLYSRVTVDNKDCTFQKVEENILKVFTKNDKYLRK
jgi:hypothetical protein